MFRAPRGGNSFAQGGRGEQIIDEGRFRHKSLSDHSAGLYKGRRREAKDEEEERGGYVRYRVLPPEWAPRIHMIPSPLRPNYSWNCLAFFGFL